MSGSRIKTEELALSKTISDSSSKNWTVAVFDEVQSTMDEARKLAATGIEFPALVMTHSQSAGRGRRGRQWDQTKGGLYATFVFPTLKKTSELSAFSLTAGIVLHKIFKNIGCSLKVKWPNDLISIEKGKVGGILLELAEFGSKRVILCGIGINLLSAPINVARTVSIKELCGNELTSEQALNLIAPALYEAFTLYEREGFERFRKEWLSEAHNLGREVTLSLEGESVTGVFEGVGDNGELSLLVAGKRRYFPSGDLNLD